MTEGRLLRQLFRAAAQTGGSEFRRVAEEVIRGERLKKHYLLANDLERILYGEHGGEPSGDVTLSRDIPTDRERGLPLLEVRQTVRDLQDIVLSDENRSVLTEVLLEQSRAEILASHGLKPASRLLLCGPPGCGKTTAAEVLATELGVSLAIVRFDTVVSSLLGETAANLRKVFDFLEGERLVALFDEFDAIGKERDDPGEHGELKRVVNAFLQMMDGFRGKSLLVAATNHERLLDLALWRRFDEVMFLDKPNLEQIRQLFIIKLRGVRYELPIDDPSFLNQFKGLAHADIERVLVRAIKWMVLQGREFLTMELIEAARKREEHRLQVVRRL